MENGKVVSLNSYTSIIDAEFDADILKQNDIKCKINQSIMANIYPIPLFTEQQNPLEILVFQQDKQKAIEILNDYHNSADNI